MKSFIVFATQFLHQLKQYLLVLRFVSMVHMQNSPIQNSPIQKSPKHQKNLKNSPIQNSPKPVKFFGLDRLAPTELIYPVTL